MSKFVRLVVVALVLAMSTGCGLIGAPGSKTATRKTPGTGTSQAPGPKGTGGTGTDKPREYKLCQAVDRTMGIEAARTIIPADWTCESSVAWNFSSWSFPGNVNLFARSPSQEGAAQRLSSVEFEQMLVVPMLQGDINTMYPDGGYNDASGHPILALKTPQEYLEWLFQHSANVSDVQISSVTTAEQDKDLAAAESANIEQITRTQAESNRILAGKMVFSDPTAQVNLITFSFTGEGRRLDAKALVPIISQRVQTLSNGQVVFESIQWQVVNFSMYSAVSGKLKSYSDDADLFFNNCIANAQWLKVQSQVGEKLMKDSVARSQAALDSVNAWVRQQTEAQNRDYQDTIANRQAAQDSAFAGWGDTMLGLDAYKGPDGGLLKVETKYDHVYSDGSGRILASEGPADVPDGYQQIQKVR